MSLLCRLPVGASFCILLVLATEREASGSCPPPDWLDVEIARDVTATPDKVYIVANFGWDGNGTPTFVPGCSADEAFELEFVIDTYPLQKCFAQPIGGRDEELHPKSVTLNLPDSGYVDVWNYFFTYSGEEIQEIFNQECSDLGDDLDLLASIAAAFYDFTLKNVEDDVANFAVGVRNSSEFLTDFSYGFEYRLEIPPGCADDPEAGWGYVDIAMSTFPNTCDILWLTTSCPHFIGFPLCAGTDPDGDRTFLARRVCAPTDTIRLGDLGTVGAGQLVDPPGKTGCYDHDNDTIFDHQSKRMYGTNVGDCNDDNAAIGNGGYNPQTNTCTVCTPEVSGVWPSIVGLGSRAFFGVQGECLPTSTAFFIENCGDVRTEQILPTMAEFSCIPTGAIGSHKGVVKDKPGGGVLLDFQVDFVMSNTCPNGNGRYCGESVGLENGSLYECVDGTYTKVQVCTNGCHDAGAGNDDYCSQVENNCPSGNGFYCGESVGLTPGTLYSCVDGMYTEDVVCPDGCVKAGDGNNDYCENVPTCTYEVVPMAPNESYAAPYDCPGGVVMPISGSIDPDSGILTVSSLGKAGDYGPGNYRVVVFDPNDDPSQQCKSFNFEKVTKVLGQTSSSITFPAFDSLLECGGAPKAYCIQKEDGGNLDHFCSGMLDANYL